MRLLLLITALTLTLDIAHAIEAEFIGPCSTAPLFAKNIHYIASNVGELTVYTLKKEFIPFTGSEEGILTVFGTPTGLDAQEVLSDEEMRSYGWCFQVDGKTPMTYPHETGLTQTAKKVTWYYGYSHYFRGNWSSFCEPAYKIKPAFLCAKN